MVNRLVVISGPDQGVAFSLAEGEPLLFGRGVPGPTRLQDTQVSRVHCRVDYRDGRFILKDLASKTGTLLNGERISEHELGPGDVIRIGTTELRYQVEEATQRMPAEQRAELKRKVAQVAPELDEAATGTQTPLAPAPAASAAPKPRKLADLAGSTLYHFEIGRQLAIGRSGIVFQARDIKGNCAIALKVLAPDFSKSEEEMKRFVRAMKTVLVLRHPNIVALHGAGKTGPFCWIAMELVEGESLTQLIERLGTGGMLEWTKALRVAIHVARALECAHEKGIIHRNITPTNILIRAQDQLSKLGDLLLAKAIEGTQAQQITRPGEMLGELAFMSPERTIGSDKIDGRSDIYSLGATVYALLTGRPPCVGQSLLDTVLKIQQAEPEKPKRFQVFIPDRFEAAVMRMLAKRPEERFASATELRTELEEIARDQSHQA
jgi:pSer/pThr/pTyr-binding forkhead associated (FHA) protein